jgi:hypothetical protein
MCFVNIHGLKEWINKSSKRSKEVGREEGRERERDSS